jgi:hypothetical protein
MKGVVVCPQPRAADVGAAVLDAGGNAFDALVATAFAQMGWCRLRALDEQPTKAAGRVRSGVRLRRSLRSGSP